jgi:hypothetical protein
MTASRDPDRLIAAFLEEGPEVLPDWVHGAVRDEIHDERQSAARGLWRTSMMRKYLATAAAAAVVVAGAALVATRSPEVGLGDPPPTSPTAEAQSVRNGGIEPGASYRTDGFSQPFRFTLPDAISPGGASADLMDAHSFRIRPVTGGAITFHDDADLSDDVCQPAGLADHFSTPDDVRDWLEGSEGVTVGTEHELVTADGRTALAWDIGLGTQCYTGDAAVSFAANEHHRVYAVPIGEDTVLVFTWGRGYGGEGEDVLPALNAATDDLVQSMSFD